MKHLHSLKKTIIIGLIVGIWGHVAFVHASDEPPITNQTGPSQVMFSQRFHYVRQFSRLDYAFNEGNFSNTSENIRMQDIDLYRLTSIISAYGASLFLEQGIYTPKIVEFDPFNNTFDTIASVNVYQWEVGLFFHLGPVRLGTSFVEHNIKERLFQEQKWIPTYARSMRHYAAVQYAPFKGPIHIEGRLDVNPQNMRYEKYYWTASLGVVVYFNYYVNMKLRYYQVNNGAISLNRHVAEYLFVYHVSHYTAFMVGLSKIIYSEVEAPTDMFMAGFQYFIDIW